MRQALSDYRLFWREFRQNFRTTGAVLPSGRSLSRCLSRYVAGATSGRRILEVGPGTGAVTREIVRRLHADDRLDLVELNEQFVTRLRTRFDHEPPFADVAGRVRILHQPVESLPIDEPYDLIVSGLPLNNFSVADVERILARMMGLLRPGGTLSFFEYLGVRKVKSWFGSRREQARLRGIGRVLRKLLVPHEVRRDWVWPNVPPAWVHHIRRPVEARQPAVADPAGAFAEQSVVDRNDAEPSAAPDEPLPAQAAAKEILAGPENRPSRAGQGSERTTKRPLAVGKAT